MASRILSFLTTRPVAAGGAVAATATAAVLGSKLYNADPEYSAEEAVVQFNTSYGFIQNGQQIVKPPDGWKGRLFQIRNDYPKLSDIQNKGVMKARGFPILPGPDTPIYVDPKHDAPWLNVDFEKDPLRYCELIKEYCWEGNVNNDFVLQDNKQRNWYHAPWMHWSPNGREPLNGLTFERPTPTRELSKTQDRPLQTWACGFYNEPGASILLTNATDAEVFTMKGAPSMKAVIAPDDAKSAAIRNSKPSDLRLLQVDFAVTDERAKIGWVFGTFMYYGDMKEANPWNRIIPVGIMWGNDPELTPQRAREGDKPKQSWINPVAEDIRKALGGARPSWGWLGRMNGPADNFISACASCHSASEHGQTKKVSLLPSPKDSDAEKMKYFRNIWAGQPFTDGAISGDYSLQLMIGYSNFLAWTGEQKAKTNMVYSAMLRLPTKAARDREIIDSIRQPLRASEDDLKSQGQKRRNDE
ncbi:hypothetical protein GQ607_004144 [Colletotrichum asianum]|uniref:Cytochrome c domain-containing protein n=1 Tax=Colletotrichum asianum TaxID=702518 RepID=A0A8H3ZV50_9PEZI|nr:hypothetical protein GQ607_004144 [Colletotrichum asianum]